VAKEVVVYVTGYCPYCRAAKEFLKSKKIRFREIDVSGDEEERRALAVKSGGRETVPQIFADGVHIGGFDDLVAYYHSGKTL
jgi:glutaredoxin 3